MRVKAVRPAFVPRKIRDERDLLKLWLLTLAALLLSTLAPAGDTVKSKPQIGPDMSGVLRVTTRTSLAHACPISPTLALTAAHVIDPAPLSPTTPLVGGYWTTEFGSRGPLVPMHVDPRRDLGFVVGEFPRFYAIAKEAPTPGLPVYALGYDFRSTKNPLGTRIYKLVVERIVGGSIIMTGDNPETGSSGGCVFNAPGAVVGVIEGSMLLDNGSKVAMAVGVWGETFTIPEVK